MYLALSRAQRLLMAVPVFALSAISTGADQTSGGLLTAGEQVSSAPYPVWAQTSLQRVFPRSEAGTSTSYSMIAARNQSLSFQICAQNGSAGVVPAEVTIADDANLDVRVRRVGYVPMDHHTPHTRKEELDGVGHLPGMVPDPLFNESKGSIGPWENLSFWVTLKVPEDAQAGFHKLAFSVQAGKDQKTTITASVDVRDVTLQTRKDFPVTHWWRPDAIFKQYKQEPYGEDFFAMTEKYMRNMIEHGNNVLFVPSIEGRRENFQYPMQMLFITRDGDKWNFDFKNVRRLVHMGQKLGFEYFEFPHLWLYWGVKNAVPVYLTSNGKYERVWPADSDGFAPDYLNFLKQYLDALHAFLRDEDILDKSFHHLSDEPNLGGLNPLIDMNAPAKFCMSTRPGWMGK